MTSARDRRVTLALKWHYLDQLDPEQIRDRMDREGIADLTTSTIRDYLNEKPAEEVIEQIEDEQANIRLQSAERFERLYQRAREAEQTATREERITAMIPKMNRVPQNEEPLRVADWERVPPGDDRRPPWADERDTVIVFVDNGRFLDAGEEYPVGARRAGQPARPGTQPEYRKATVGIERDAENPEAKAMARSEQAKFQQEKADVLGVYSTDINMNVDGELGLSVELGEETAAAVREAALEEKTDE